MPERILRAMARPTIDHRGPEFARMATELLEGLQEVFNTKPESYAVFSSLGQKRLTSFETELCNSVGSTPKPVPSPVYPPF